MKLTKNVIIDMVVIMYIVYGGAFNPPTKAHYEIVNLILTKYPNAKVIVLPVGKAYNKANLVSFNDRFNMLKLMFKNNSNVMISNLEDTNEFKGTFESLEKLSETYDNIHLLMGSDNIYNLDNWIKYKALLTNYPLIIISRNDDNINEIMKKYKNLNVKYDVIKYNQDISSTLIRSDINKHFNLLEKDVYKYILENDLYEVNNDV